MKWETIFALVVAGPILALCVGAATLLFKIGDSWTAQNTNSLIVGLVATCGGGVVVIGILLAIIIGIPIAIRMYGEAGHSRRAWNSEPPARQLHMPLSPTSPFWVSNPPLLPDKQQGSWQSVGQQGYDLWSSHEPPKRDDNFS